MIRIGAACLHNAFFTLFLIYHSYISNLESYFEKLESHFEKLELLYEKLESYIEKWESVFVKFVPHIKNLEAYIDNISIFVSNFSTQSQNFPNWNRILKHCKSLKKWNYEEPHWLGFLSSIIGSIYWRFHFHSWLFLYSAK